MKNFWERRLMWVWCFDNWVKLMKNSPEFYESFECDRHFFWLYLNNYNQLFGTNDQFAEDDAFDPHIVVVNKMLGMNNE